MKAHTYELQEIFKIERRYVVPTFQRDYEWTADGQWGLLAEDLGATADRLLELRERVPDANKRMRLEKELSPHFLGAVVCGSLPFSTGGVVARSVIDGQQRLTTLQLLIRGLLDVLAETDSKKRMGLERMLSNPEDVVMDEVETHKLWPRRRDRDVWPLVMGHDIPEYRPGDHLYLQARKFFADFCREYAGEDEPQRTTRLDALADALSVFFKLVVIDLDDNDDAQVIFEVLNGRQTQLSAIDLVKNLVFLRSELNEEDVDRLYDRYWAQFDDDWWKETVGRGHAQRGRRDVLLSVWLTTMTGTEVNVGHLYRIARNYLDNGPNTETILSGLSTFAQAYRVIYGSPASTTKGLARAYERIRFLEITTAIPLLAWLRTLPSEELSEPDHVSAVRAVESWAIRRVYTGGQTRGYGSHFTRVLREAQTAHADGRNIASAVIGALQSGVLHWPNDQEVEEAFQSMRIYRNIAQYRIRLLLGAVDEFLRAENPHEPAAHIDYDGLQIEHVMPQSWEASWPLYSDDGQKIPHDDGDPAWTHYSGQRQRVIDSVGNLTLVTGSFNQALSNKGWELKRREFEKQKSLVINHSVAQRDDWDEATILERSVEIARAACAIWPGADVLGGEVRG